MFLKKILKIFVQTLLLCVCVAVVDTRSQTWGHVNKYMSPIYELDVIARRENAIIDVTFPGKNFSNNYTITAMHAEDLLSNEENDTGAMALLLSGGIGSDHATVRFMAAQSEQQSNLRLHFAFEIYGLDL